MQEMQFIELTGTALERGQSYGQEAKEAILNNLAFYKAMFEEGYDVKWEAAQETAKRFMPFIEHYDPVQLEEMRGIALGAGVSFEDILTLNCRSEILFANPDGCTVLGVIPELSDSGHTLLGQNWDWLGPARGNTVMLKIKEPQMPSILMLAEAGMVGGKGMNSAGVGVTLNATSVGRGGLGVPLHAMYRKILKTRRAGEALDAVIKTKRAGSGTFNIGTGDGFLMSVEFTPDAFDVWMPKETVLAHTNHYISPVFAKDDALKEVVTDSVIRLNRIRRLARRYEGIGVSDFFEMFADHANQPDSICSHEDESDPPHLRLCTIYSVVMDLTDRKMWVANGNPCEAPYNLYSLII